MDLVFLHPEHSIEFFAKWQLLSYDPVVTLSYLFISLRKQYVYISGASVNIAGRLPEKSRNSFVDLQSKKTVKKTHQK